MNYLSKRPFLVIIHREVPNATSRLLESYEDMIIVDRVTHNHLTRATLVIDILNGKIVKNRNIGGTEEEIFQTYISRYEEDIRESIEVWGRSSPENLAIIRQFAEAIAQKEEENNE